MRCEVEMDVACLRLEQGCGASSRVEAKDAGTIGLVEFYCRWWVHTLTNGNIF